jgi:hypothetical protein
MISGAESKDLEGLYATTPQKGVLRRHAFAAMVLQYNDMPFRASRNDDPL